MSAPIGLFGGTFDPIHQGHVNLVSQLAEQVGLEKVWVMPCLISPHKQGPGVQSHHRLAMAKLATEHHDMFQVSDWELTQTGPSYTVQTLEMLRDQDTDKTIMMFMGMDSLIRFTQWRRWQDILKMCHLLVNQRPGYHISQIDPVLQTRLTTDVQSLKHQSTGKIYLGKGQEIDISSSQIRQALPTQKTCPDYLGNKVFMYIKQHELYSC